MKIVSTKWEEVFVLFWIHPGQLAEKESIASYQQWARGDNIIQLRTVFLEETTLCFRFLTLKKETLKKKVLN